MENQRPDPDALLASLKKEESRQKRGKLKIFLGMCPGVGKTYAMLQAARQRQAEGVEVLAGVVETHGRAETEALLEGMAVAGKRELEYRGTRLKEMDLDTVLMIRPRLVLVDELAHTNVPGSRHPKRYQDVLEILASGIDVYSTLNVQHVESRAESVRQITGVLVQETIPDSVLDEADEIVLIDLSPDHLLQRLRDGKVYMGERAVTAADNFFREQNLTALRELALRLAAERVNQDLREIMVEQNIQGPWKISERLMVAVGPTPFSESLIRWTRRAAAALNAPWMAVYVETAKKLDEEQKKRLARNLTLARQLGAEVVVRSGADVAETLLHVARQNNISQICVGKPAASGVWAWIRQESFLQRLIRQSGDIDVHLVRVKSLGAERVRTTGKTESPIPAGEYPLVLGITAGVTLLCLMLEPVTGYTSVALIYLLSVVFSGVFVSRWTVLLLGALSALLWNYLFIPPKYTFLISKPYDAMMFGMYFVVAIVMGNITSRLRERQQAEQRQEERVTTLYQITKMIAMTYDSGEALGKILEKLEESLKVQAAVFLRDEKGRLDFEMPRCGRLTLSGKEKSVAIWTFQKQEPAGRGTETLPDAEHFYLPLVSMRAPLGVLVIRPSEKGLWTLDQRNLMESFASFVMVILEKDMLARMTEESRIKAESEKLQTALLDSVSHELKTPLAVIEGSAEHLEKGLGAMTAERRLVAEIRDASRRLRQTVDGLLEMTRLDSGRMGLNLGWHDMRDIINAAVEKVGDMIMRHRLKLLYADALPLVKVDGRILEQVFQNLITNAALYAPENTEITVSVQADAEALNVQVMDEGPGIDDEDLEKIFEKFYRGKNTPPGGLGLGLSIARRFIAAHGGILEVYNRETGGACFNFRLPVDFFRDEGKGPG